MTKDIHNIKGILFVKSNLMVKFVISVPRVLIKGKKKKKMLRGTTCTYKLYTMTPGTFSILI